jgi:hypothetical protein
VFKLVAIMLVSLPICMALLKFVSPLSIAIMGVVAVVGVLLLMVESYFVFGLKDVWTEFGQKMRANTPIA